jgi:tetratricopeptide (TPR) repeat protein
MPPLTIGDLERRLADARLNGDRAAEKQALRDLARAYEQAELWDRALSAEESALALARGGDRVEEGEILDRIGVLLIAADQPEEAVEVLERSLAITRELGERRYEGLVLADLAHATALLHAPDALPLYEQALAAAREVGTPPEQLHVLQGLAWLGEKLGRKDLIVGSLTQALDLARGLGWRGVEARQLMSLGLAHAAAQEFGAAEPFFYQAAAAFEAVGDRREGARALGNLATARARQGHAPEAIVALETALGLFEQLGMPEDVARAQAMLAALREGKTGEV